MSNPFEFTLPPAPDRSDDLDVYLGRVEYSLIDAIVGQKAGLVFPHRKPLAAHLGVEPTEAGAVRYKLHALGYLTKRGNEYFTSFAVIEELAKNVRGARPDVVVVTEHLDLQSGVRGPWPLDRGERDVVTARTGSGSRSPRLPASGWSTRSRGRIAAPPRREVIPVRFGEVEW